MNRTIRPKIAKLAFHEKFAPCQRGATLGLQAVLFARVVARADFLRRGLNPMRKAEQGRQRGRAKDLVCRDIVVPHRHSAGSDAERETGPRRKMVGLGPRRFISRIVVDAIVLNLHDERSPAPNL